MTTLKTCVVLRWASTSHPRPTDLYRVVSSVELVCYRQIDRFLSYDKMTEDFFFFFEYPIPFVPPFGLRWRGGFQLTLLWLWFFYSQPVIGQMICMRIIITIDGACLFLQSCHLESFSWDEIDGAQLGSNGWSTLIHTICFPTFFLILFLCYVWIFVLGKILHRGWKKNAWVIYL